MNKPNVISKSLKSTKILLVLGILVLTILNIIFYNFSGIYNYRIKYNFDNIYNLAPKFRDFIISFERSNNGSLETLTPFTLPPTSIEEQHKRSKEKEVMKTKNFNSLHDIHDTLWKQIHELQEEGDCEQKNIYVCNNPYYAGLGSNIHLFAACMQIAFGLGRTWFIDQPQYRHFGGLNSILKAESNRCGYLKSKYIKLKKSRNFPDSQCETSELKCYTSPLYDVNNTVKVIYHTSTGLPYPRYIPTTIPDEILTALKRFQIKKPWHWFTAQFIGYLTLRMGKRLSDRVSELSRAQNIAHPYVAMHIRRGDKSGEADFISEKAYTKAAERFFNKQRITGKKNVYLASDQKDMSQVLRKTITSLGYTNYSIMRQPYHEYQPKSYYHKNFPKEILEDMLIDIYFLVHSNYTVCTYSSNIGRLVHEMKQALPPYLENSTIISIDDQNVRYGWYGFRDDYLSKLRVTTQVNSYTTISKDTNLVTYKKGEMFVLKQDSQIKHFQIEGKDEAFVLVEQYGPHILDGLKKSWAKKGYIKLNHLQNWPGNPKYYFYR